MSTNRKVKVFVDDELLFDGQERLERFIPDPPAASELTRHDLIQLCDLALVPENEWLNRDSASAQMKVGTCRQLLKAGCEFQVVTSGQLASDDRTIWVQITFRGFQTFEVGEAEHETFYLPTIKRIIERFGSDWY